MIRAIIKRTTAETPAAMGVLKKSASGIVMNLRQEGAFLWWAILILESDGRLYPAYGNPSCEYE
jgi:hypothetical protein